MLVTLLAAAILTPGFASPPGLAYNGSAIRPSAQPTRPVPTGVAGERGYSLGELFPPQLEAWRLQLSSGTGARTVLNADDFGERLFDMYVVESGGLWDLVFDPAASGTRERFRGITVLELTGEPCPEKNIEVWVSWEGVPELKAEIKRWADRAGVTAKVVDVPSIKSKLVTVLRGGGKVPDVVMIQSDYLPDLVEAGALQPLDGLRLPTAGAKGRNAFRLSGRLFGAPFYCDAQLVFYSTALIRQAPRPDWTLDDMERLAKASGAQVGAAWNAYSAYWFLPFVIGFGKESIMGAHGKMDLRHPAYVKALTYLKDSIARKFLTPMERDAMMAYFTSGKAAFILSGSYSVPEFRRLGLPFGVAPFPLVAEGGKRLAPMLDYKGWAVTRTTKSPALSRRLIQYLSGAGIQASFCGPQGKLPADENAWALMPAGDPYLATIRASWEAGIAVPPDPVYGDFKNASWKLIRLFLGGDTNVDETLSALATIMGE
jgi:arabinogalactan oligomer/maltooligosaccharide transport system substrate-binding protein